MTRVIWDPHHECMDVEQRRELQLRRLRETVARLLVSVPLYRERLRGLGADPCDLRSIDDLRALPFTTKADLRDTYPMGLFAVPPEEVVRIQGSSGTRGNPTLVGYTREDVDIWAEVIARTLACAGGTRHDVLQIAYGYGLFTGGLGLHYGGERMGCTVVPMSAGNTRRQLMMMRDLGVTLLACTPSYALTLAEEAAAMGMAPGDLKLRSGVLGSEPWSDGMRKVIEERLGLRAYDIYGLSEIIRPGVASECSARCGLHVFDDHFIPEVVHPQTGEPLPDGEDGELVFTCVTKRCLPLLRYRTGDVSRLSHEPCACGRTHPRMGRITGRTDDMLIIRGVNVFPSQIEDVLTRIAGVEPHYRVIVSREGHRDALEVEVEVTPQMFSDTIRGLEALEVTIREELRSVLSLTAKVRLVEPHSLDRSIGKAQRVIDKRQGE